MVNLFEFVLVTEVAPLPTNSMSSVPVSESVSLSLVVELGMQAMVQNIGVKHILVVHLIYLV